MCASKFPTPEILTSFVNALKNTKCVFFPYNDPAILAAFFEACRDMHVGTPSGGAFADYGQFYYLD